ncbi:putative beta-fructofuranosidase [Dioscorea sansibarensis]
MGFHNKVFLTCVFLVWFCFCLPGSIWVGEASHVVYQELQSVSASIVGSQYRTGYHFQPPKNWINGPMYYNGIYHLFYQYNPNGSVWGNIVWAHSVSSDLINWVPLEPAIYPSKAFDINGTWSGSATILPGNKPVIFYTGIDPQGHQVQNLAFPKDPFDPYLREWTKPDYNPVIRPDASIEPSKFRDPTTAWFGLDGHWRVVIGSRRNMRGMAVLYRSRDFVTWVKAKHPLHSSKDTGMWECPDFFPVSLKGKKGLETSVNGPGVKHVLKVSLDMTRYEYYTVGRYYHMIDRYIPDNTSADDHTGLRYDYGNFYASKTFFDEAKQRRILWGWSNESDTVSDDIKKGWAGIQTIPRVLWLDPSGKQLVQWPVEELETLRGKQVDLYDKELKSGDIYEVKGILSAQADVEVSFEISGLDKAEPFDESWTDPQVLCGQKGAAVEGGVGPFGLLVLASGDREEQTAVLFRVFKAPNKHVVLMCHDPSKSSLRPNMYKPSFAGFVDVDINKTKKISLRSLIDHSVVESFGAEGKTCITSRVYPSKAIGQDAHLFVFNNGSEDVRISQLSAWEVTTPRMN